MSELPNLLVIGAMKSGTTSLHDYLNMHPDIFMSEIKELDFFLEDRNWNRGMQWYKDQFPINSLFRGESSQNYSKCTQFTGVADRVFQTLKNPKFIYIVRDPIDRILSHHNESQSVEQGWSPKDLDKYLLQNLNNKYINTSKYYMQIQAYLKYTDLKNIHVLTLERLKESPAEELNRIFSFLGVKNFNVNETIKKNSSGTKIQTTFMGKIARSKILSSLKGIISNDLKNRLKESLLYKKIIFKKVKPAKLSIETKRKIAEYILDDIKQFEKLFDLDTSQWKNFNKVKID